MARAFGTSGTGGSKVSQVRPPAIGTPNIVLAPIDNRVLDFSAAIDAAFTSAGRRRARSVWYVRGDWFSLSWPDPIHPH